jgi:hypothetical protein
MLSYESLISANSEQLRYFNDQLIKKEIIYITLLTDGKSSANIREEILPALGYEQTM